MQKRLARVLIWSLGLLLACPVASHATLIELDIFDPGGALVASGATLDDATGLVWLDLPLTSGLSFRDVLAGAGPGSGWLADGWRYASAGEVCGLLDRYAAVPTPCPTPSGGNDGKPTKAEVLGLSALFGDTIDVNPGDAFASGMFEDGGGPSAGIGNWAAGASGQRTRIISDHATPSIRNDAIGSFLVRVVPEPSTGLLLAAGLAILGRKGRRRSQLIRHRR